MANEFGELLTQGLKSVAARERNKPLAVLQDEIAAEWGLTGTVVQHYRRGNVPSPERVAYLARVCVQRGGMDAAWLRRFLVQAEYYGMEALLAELVGTSSAGRLRHNLPRRPFERFVGRVGLLEEVLRYLSPRHRVGVVCLAGIAGVGKSALALGIAHRCVEEAERTVTTERFEAVVWVTAKQVELLATGLVPRQPTFTDLDGLYRALAEVLDLPAITRAVNREAQAVIVARLLGQTRTLLVLDNLEDIDDPGLMVFLRDLPAPSKALVTTRHRIDVAVPLTLATLRDEEADALIAVEEARHTLSLSPDQHRRLRQGTGNLPLGIVRTLGRIAWRGSSGEVELQELSDPATSLYDFCFGHSMRLIRGLDAHRLFMALSLFASDASRQAVGAVAGLDEVLRRDAALSELEVLSLVSREGDRFRLEPLTQVQARAELAAHPELEVAARARWVGWYEQIAQEAEDSAHYLALGVEQFNLMAALWWLAQHEQMPLVLKLFQQAWDFLFSVGQWDALLTLAEEIKAWAIAEEDTEALIVVLQSRQKIAREKRQFSLVREGLTEIERIANRLRDEVLQAEISFEKAVFADAARQGIAGAIETMEGVVRFFEQRAMYKRVVPSLNALGNLHLRIDLEKASHYYNRGLHTLETHWDEIRSAREWRAILKGNLAIVAGRSGKPTEACQGLCEIIDDLTSQADFAEAFALLAFYEYQRGNMQQALTYRARADHIIEWLGLGRPVCDEDTQWQELFG